MNHRLQPLVLAQIAINRAVFEANQAKPRELYIDECIADAQGNLADAAAMEVKHRKRLKLAKKKTA